MMTINDYKDFATYATENNLQWTSRKLSRDQEGDGTLQTLLSLGQECIEGFVTVKHISTKKADTENEEKKNCTFTVALPLNKKLVFKGEL